MDARAWNLVKISAIIAGLIILFFSGLFPVEDILTYAPQSGLTASVVPADVASLTNAERVKNGLSPLTVSPLLTEAAQMKAEDMARGSYYAHVGPDGKTPLDWLQAAGYRYLNAGENLVIDRTTSAQAVDAWMHSPDHRENILRPQFTEIGIGVAKGKYEGINTIFVVQEFGTPYPTRIATVAPKPLAAPTAAKSQAVPAKAAAAPSLSVSTLPKPAIVTTAATYVKPVAKLSVDSTSAPASASTTQSSTTAATSTVSFTLAPEFFTPIVVAAPVASSEKATPQAESFARPSFIHKIRLYLSHISATLRTVL